MPQQILLKNSSLVQRRIPNSEHFCCAFENVSVPSVKQSGLVQDAPSMLQHLTAPVWLVEIMYSVFWMLDSEQWDQRPPEQVENKYLRRYILIHGEQEWNRDEICGLKFHS